jgi:hypothetical protein
LAGQKNSGRYKGRLLTKHVELGDIVVLGKSAGNGQQAVAN